MRQIVLDTETTGLEPRAGHRIIEIGAVELEDRKLTGRHYHRYINPQREIDAGAVEVHGITEEFLADKPLFTDLLDEFLDFIRDSELVIHNAAFDVGFIDHELGLAGSSVRVDSICSVLDSLAMARQKHPGQKNNLDALCKRYGVDNSQRDLHGALLDAEILADVYLLMSGGQTKLSLGGADSENEADGGLMTGFRRVEGRVAKPIRSLSDEEASAHETCLNVVDKACGNARVWRS